MKSNELSVLRAPDREKMAKAIELLAIECGAKCVRKNSSIYGEKCLNLYVSASQGLSVSVLLDGKSCQPDMHILNWHMDGSTKAELNDLTFGGDVNRFHRMKATYIARGFEQLSSLLKKALLMAQDGTAFLPHTI